MHTQTSDYVADEQNLIFDRGSKFVYLLSF